MKWIVPALLLVTLAGCGGVDLDDNKELEQEVRTFVASGADTPRPFELFTSWEWDELYVVSLDGASEDYVRKMTGEDLNVPWGGKSGVFVYYQDGKRVRAELLDQGAFCTGIYTRTAVVDPRYGCWLHDENKRAFPVK